jgi:hypothetical protein
MVVYICSRCKRKWNHKAVYTKHLNRKNPCEIIEDSKENIESKKYENTDTMKDELKKLTELVEELVVGKKNMEESINVMTRKIESLEKMVMTKKDGDVYNNIVVNNNEIRIVAFGKEDWSILSDEEKIGILDGGFKSVHKYVKAIHMNKNKQEFNNIFVCNIKEKKHGVFIYDGEKWIRDNFDKIDDVRDRGINFVEFYKDIFKNQGKLPDDIDAKITRFISKLDGDNGNALKKELSDEIKLLLYNHGRLMVK